MPESSCGWLTLALLLRSGEELVRGHHHTIITVLTIPILTSRLHPPVSLEITILTPAPPRPAPPRPSPRPRPAPPLFVEKTVEAAGRGSRGGESILIVAACDSKQPHRELLHRAAAALAVMAVLSSHSVIVILPCRFIGNTQHNYPAVMVDCNNNVHFYTNIVIL